MVLLFIPLGLITAQKFAPFRALPAYTINVLGSLAGILLYTLVSFWGWSPEWWFTLTGFASLYFLAQTQSGRALALNATLALTVILLAALWKSAYPITVWSPYYRIDLKPIYAAQDPNLELGYELSVNRAWHQRLLNLGNDFVQQNYATDPEHFDTRLSEYDAPYQAAYALNNTLKNVLIVGAGTGNDVAAALRANANHITAVEIDPTIVRLGQQLHPEQPYANSQRVRIVNQDARAIFRSDTTRYDLIVFGRLDSHTLFSTSSSVRLDNFVYTREALSEVRGLLAPNGLLALTFGVPAENQWVGERIYRELTDVFGHPPQAYRFLNNDILFLIALQPIQQQPALQNPHVTYLPDYTYRPDLPPATDDWPYLYLQNRSIPANYLVMLAGILLISTLMLRRALPDFRQFNLHFFFMGAAFFLLETKSIAELALLLGSTWVVNAIVIAAILLMIVLANILVERRDITNPRPAYALLAVALLLNFFFSPANLLGLPLTARIVLATALQALPLFFAGIIFAITFSRATVIGTALGSNMLGAVLGGVVEYTSLILGIRPLYLLALGFYALSLWALQRNL